MKTTMPSRPLCAAPGQRPAKYVPAAMSDIRVTLEKYRRLQQMQQTECAMNWQDHWLADVALSIAIGFGLAYVLFRSF